MGAEGLEPSTGHPQERWYRGRVPAWGTDEPGPNISSVTGFPWGCPEGSHLFFLLQHICTKCWYKPILTSDYKESFRSGQRCQALYGGFCCERSLWPSRKMLCFCSLQRSSSLLTQCGSLPSGKPAMQRTSVASLGSELPGGKNISWRTQTMTAPCPGRACEKGCEVFVIFGKLVLPFCPVFQIVKTACPVRATNYN